MPHSVRNKGARPLPRRARRGGALFAATLATALAALAATEWARYQNRVLDRGRAEILAATLAARAWALDNWVHSEAQASAMRPAPGTTATPRALTPNPGAIDDLSLPSGGSAAPWALTADSPAAGWRTRYFAGWLSGADPAAGGGGPPYGVIVASPVSSEARRIAGRVRESLARRGAGFAAPDPSSNAPDPGDVALAIARAAGYAPGALDIAVPAWLYGGIEPRFALRLARAGQPPPNAGAGIGFAAGSQVAADEIYADSASFLSISDRGTGLALSAGGSLAAGELEAGSLAAGGNVIGSAGATISNRLRADLLEASRLETASGAAKARQAVLANGASPTSVSVNLLSVDGAAAIAVSASADSAGFGAVEPVALIDVRGDISITERAWSPLADVDAMANSGRCYGC
ncbi:MAG: hypothetical protein OXI64_00295 [Defluviicoccus sp.]|nr:hypothetical protein [Defluviicoccus sp.]